MTTTIHHGDCLEVMRSLPDNSVHAIVTDPPYGLSNTTPEQVAETIVKWVSGERDYLPSGRGFMNRAWDAFVPPVAVWDEAMRVLKPGGHVLAFAGTRTHDLMTLGLRLAGFDIRDSIAWLYGSGFPKSMDVSKAIDKGHGLTAERAREFQAWLRQHITPKQINEATGTDMGHHWTTHPTQPGIATADLFDKIRPHLPPVPERIERLVAERSGISWADYQARIVGERPAYGIGGNGILGGHAEGATMKITGDGTTEAARQWQGWGTALKPATEPIVMARKPFRGTVAANVLEHGTGAINVDACRIGVSEGDDVLRQRASSVVGDTSAPFGKGIAMAGRVNPSGRWPANVILDEHMAGVLDEQSGWQKDGVAVNRNKDPEATKPAEVYGKFKNGALPDQTYGGGGGASRFFYVAKASKRERPVVDGVSHPTTKPLTLMRYLVRMVTPPGGTVLEPFAGSGTTIEAAMLEGFDCIGIEREAEYLPLIHERIRRATEQLATEDPEQGSFSFEETA